MSENLHLVKGAFPEQMEIWLVTENVTSINDFEEIFHRKPRYIRDLNSLIEAVDQTPKYTSEDGTQEYVYASIIFYRAMPPAIVSELSNVINILKIIEKVNVYEVERDDKSYPESHVYGSINQLEKEYKGLDRSEYIHGLPGEDKQKRVLEELDLEVQRLRQDLANREENYVKLTKEYKDLVKKNNDLKSQVDTEVNIHAREREKELEDTKKTLREIRDNLDLTNKNLLNHRQQIKELDEEKFNLEYTQEALKLQIARLEDDVKLQDEDYTSLEEEFRILQEERADLLIQTSDGERFATVLEDLERLRLQLTNTEKELKATRIQFRNEEMRNKDLEATIELQRRGQISEEYTGRTAILDHIELRTTDLIYIKVVDNLPYHRSAVQSLFNKVDRHYNGKARMAIISHDDGLDEYRYEGINKYRSLDDVDIRDKQFLLHPNTSMFTGGDIYEQGIDLLFVMDYTGGNDYLVKSVGITNVMTMVRYASMLKDSRLGLEGIPLTLGEESIYDLSYDSRIASSGVKRNRERMIDINTDKWLDQLKLR